MNINVTDFTQNSIKAFVGTIEKLKPGFLDLVTLLLWIRILRRYIH